MGGVSARHLSPRSDAAQSTSTPVGVPAHLGPTWCGSAGRSRKSVLGIGHVTPVLQVPVFVLYRIA